MSSARKDNSDDLEFDAYDCTSAGWDQFYENASCHLVGQCDDSGSSLYDRLLDIDEGGAAAGAPALPAGAIAQSKALARKTKRSKMLFKVLYSWLRALR